MVFVDYMNIYTILRIYNPSLFLRNSVNIKAEKRSRPLFVSLSGQYL